MRDFACPNCGQQLAFENSVCLSCSSRLGFSLEERALLVIGAPSDDASPSDTDGIVCGDQFRLCGNLHAAQCNWIVEVSGDETGGSSGSDPVGADPVLCRSCRLTRTRPNDLDPEAMAAFAEAEAAKRRLIMQLTELGLPIVGCDRDQTNGLAFDLLCSTDDPVITGHQNGVITLDLAEANDPHREQLRVEMDEPYRTLLGHFRHEIGHYYYTVLVVDDEVRRRFGELFGDPDTDYQAAMDRHYSEGNPPGWEDDYISSYATMHPAEDWAETFAHYLHIRDALDTAAAFGYAPAGAGLDRPLVGRAGFGKIIDRWLPLSWALNMVNRSMGHPDLYPFVLPDPVLDKMRLVHDLCVAS